MQATAFLDALSPLGIDFFTGVPDSLLQPLNETLVQTYGLKGRHIVAANEGGAVGLAAGYAIATGKPALVYLQNSGLGNALNPAVSLLHERVYGIPCVFVVGWRGEPGVKDEPQHAWQGVISRELMELMGWTVFVLDAETESQSLDAFVEQAETFISQGRSIAFLVRKGGLTGGAIQAPPSPALLTREEALREILLHTAADDVFVSTTGKASREVYELREALGQGHEQDFLTVGSMGHAGMIALGIALARPDRTVWCLDGDGAALMHLGALAIEAEQPAPNLVHVLLNNGAHESVGGMPVAGGTFRFQNAARALGFNRCEQVETLPALRTALFDLRTGGTAGERRFLEIILKQDSRTDLGRPAQTPKENLLGLRKTLNTTEGRSI